MIKKGQYNQVYIVMNRDGFNRVGALGPGSCGGPVFVSQGEENKLGLIRAKLSHIWPK